MNQATGAAAAEAAAEEIRPWLPKIFVQFAVRVTAEVISPEATDFLLPTSESCALIVCVCFEFCLFPPTGATHY